MDIDFYKRMIIVYNERNVSPETWKEFYEIMFADIAKIKPEALMPEHLEMFKLAEDYFAFKDMYEKADMLKQLTSAAKQIFKAREAIEKLKNDLVNKNQN